jgi:agmatine/peptidylarginine deiminase
MAWVLTPELKAMAWPARLSEHAIFVTGKRVVQRADDWEFDDWGGHDQAFVMTNNDEEALWITLKYSY